MKPVISLFLVLVSIGLQAHAERTAKSVKTPQMVYDFGVDPRTSYEQVSPLDKKDDRPVGFSFSPNFKRDGIDCQKFECRSWGNKRVGSDLVLEVSIYKKGSSDSIMEKDLKVGTIRGNRIIDFTIPHKTRIVGARSARLFCLDINIPTIGSSGKCEASTGSYDITLF